MPQAFVLMALEEKKAMMSNTMASGRPEMKSQERRKSQGMLSRLLSLYETYAGLHLQVRLIFMARSLRRCRNLLVLDVGNGSAIAGQCKGL